MSKHHKHISLLVSFVLIVGIMSSFYLMSSLSSTPLTSFSVARAINLGDYVKNSLGVQNIDYASPSENKDCFNSAKETFSALLLLEPKQIEKYDVPGKNGFAHFVYTGAYDVGVIKIKKNANLVELSTSEEKLVFAKYADQKRTIGLNLSLKGILTESTFSITEGILNSDGMKCEFKWEKKVYTK